MAIFPKAKTAIPFRKIEAHGLIKNARFAGGRILRVDPAALDLLARTAFHDLSFFLPAKFLAELAGIMDDPAASENERFVASALIENAIIAAQGSLPLCQDTGVANVWAQKGEAVITGANDSLSLSKGIAAAYRRYNLRYSLVCPETLFEEADSGTNLPAQIDIEAVPGAEYKFFFMAKGGGSSNKTMLFQENKSLLEEKKFTRFLMEKLPALGVAACPPYHIGIAVGGTSPEQTLKTAKLAAAGYYDALPARPSGKGAAFRVPDWEQKIVAMTGAFGLGAQFGGRHFAVSARLVRLPRHAGSCHVGLAVSCVAHRNLSAVINADGIFVEKLETDPGRYLAKIKFAEAPLINLELPMSEIKKSLARHPVGTRVRLSGAMVVARDMAHMKIAEILARTGAVPDYFREHPVYYAGPAKTPKGMPCGSFGPTTAQRMDPYLDGFMSVGASLVTVAKGNRAAHVSQSCKKHGGFYLGTIGGSAALVAKNNVIASQILDFKELGMEAVRKIIVKDMPAFIICDDKGNSLY